MAANTIEGLGVELEAFRAVLTDVRKDLATLKRDMEGRATNGALQAGLNAVNLRADEINRVAHLAMSKVQMVLSPPETLAFLGVDELATLKTRIRQFMALDQEIKQTLKALVDRQLAYDQGQAAVVR